MVYRDGPLGALMDEYERATEDLKRVVGAMKTEPYQQIRDAETQDPGCRSIMTVMNHVIRAGYGYANYIRKHFGLSHEPRLRDYAPDTPYTACRLLDEMLAYTSLTLQMLGPVDFDRVVENKFEVAWGQTYDLEQMLEHAIVHVLRHRRQAERWLQGN